MYHFIDVTQVSEESLPSEAMLFNGEYIENQITGYRTLCVSGREALSPELIGYETGVRDGSKLQGKRYPERIIVVTYQIAAKSNEEFREAYNRLGSILDVKEVKIIFDDEPDKYFIGTPSYIDEVEPGKNTVVGKFEITCNDPFKYSTVEYTAEPSIDENSVLIDYGGTYKSYPVLEADFYDEKDVADDGETAQTLTGNGDCGYIAFFTEDEKIVQLGDPDEKDTETGLAKSQTLINQGFQTTTAWGTTAKSYWEINNGVAACSMVKNGTIGIGIASYATTSTQGQTSGTIFTGQTPQELPRFNYKVTYKTSNRTQTGVRVTASITGSLKNSTSYFGGGYGLRACLYIGGRWYTQTLKPTADWWRGQTGHTITMTINVTGISASTKALTGIKFKTERTDSLGGQQAGVMPESNCSNISVAAYISPSPATYYLTATAFGAAPSSEPTTNGATITRTLGADAAGAVGAKDFTMTYKQKMSIGSQAQYGAFQCVLTNAKDQIVAAVYILKSAWGGKANLYFYAGNMGGRIGEIDLSAGNKTFGGTEKEVQATTITKSGNNVSFSVGGVKKTITVSSEYAETLVTKITFVFARLGSNNALAYNGLYWCKFVKNNCSTYKDIPNKFSASDVVEADCKTGTIYLNGVETPSLGALGNDWENFTLTKGINQVGFSYSDWVTDAYKPKIKVRYREVFL